MKHIKEQHADLLGIDKEESAARDVQAPKKPGMDVLIEGNIEHNRAHQSESASAQAPEKTIEVEAIENPLGPETPRGAADDSDDAEFLNRAIEELCMSKAEEFALLGYDGITGKEIWEFLSENYAKTGIPPLHRLVDDILSLKVTTYMNWLTLNAYKGFKLDE
ncbi:hypothetical protein PRECH8_21920 [Insulibacter thermoxylanivorax]|uniref:Post-transcriptional regulator n=1 Tax=Insulibacter thermoxylanivorax TaxID=2749268 RepID=A0A916QI58_9BACL|nr:post-transcriptional regulator [Insulibacter thermoxylanivorax]GFR38896.1 hypothetical protein PRECH8_21920 [Insulibacter thermoxylanivorax]